MVSADTTIEVLFPEFGNQGGDNGNEMYLRACLPDARFIHTHRGDVPYFTEHVPSFILCCNMTEQQQDISVKELMPYKERLAELADSGVSMLFCGSAAELLGTWIVDPDGTTNPALDLFSFTTHRNMPKRYLDVVLGTFVPAPGEDPIEIAGFKAQFTQMEGHNESCFFCEDEVGFGLNVETKLEGWRRGGLIATWIIGPLLPENPDFVRWLLDEMGEKDASLAFEEEARAAHGTRVRTFRVPGMHLTI